MHWNLYIIVICPAIIIKAIAIDHYFYLWFYHLYEYFHYYLFFTIFIIGITIVIDIIIIIISAEQVYLVALVSWLAG